MRISDWSSDVCSSDLDLLAGDVECEIEVDRIDHVHLRTALPGLAHALVQQRHFETQLAADAEDHVGVLDPGDRHAERFGAGAVGPVVLGAAVVRSEEHTSELQSLMRISYAVFCLKKKTNIPTIQRISSPILLLTT